MKVFVVTCDTNYGPNTVIIKAEDEESAREIAENHNTVWPGYDIFELGGREEGVVYDQTSYA